MTRNIESVLRNIVHSSTKKAAINEWKEASEGQEVPLYNYRMDHIEQVVQMSKHLAEGTDANLDVIHLAAWLHDLAKPGVGGISAERHGIVSAELAEDILSQEGISVEVIEQVSDAIRKHVGLTIEKPLEPIEAQIIWEADKILKLGMIGLLQYVLNGVRFNPGRSLKDIADDLSKFLSLAERIAQCMVTNRGRELARHRLETLTSVVRNLEGELNLSDT